VVTRVVQLPMFTATPLGILSGDVPCSQEQRMHLRTAIGWRSMELVSERFDTPSYVDRVLWLQSLTVLRVVSSESRGVLSDLKRPYTNNINYVICA